jgi:hypothetical protein
VARFCSQASALEGKPASPHVRRGFFRLLRFVRIFLRLRDQAEAYTPTAQFGSPSIRITSMLRPLKAHMALMAHTFRTTESPIAGPSRLDLVRFVRFFLTFLHTQQQPSVPAPDFTACGKTHVLYRGTTSQVAEKFMLCIRARLYRLRKSSCFVSGHDFSRAAQATAMRALAPGLCPLPGRPNISCRRRHSRG